MRVTNEYSFPIKVDVDEAINRLKSVTSDKASVKNMIKNKKYYGTFNANTFNLNSMSEWVNIKGKIEDNRINLNVIYTETDKKSLVIGFRILAYIFIAIIGLLSFIIKENIVGNIIFILAMLRVSELIVLSIKIYQRTHTINPDIYVKDLKKILQ